MPSSPDIVVFQDAESLAAGAAERIADFVRANAGGTVTVGMAGGSTPAATYAQLARMDVPWDRVYAWVGDERFVAPEHEDNNGSMVRTALLDDTDATFFPVPWIDGGDPHEIAADYEATLVEIMNHDQNGPRPDLLLAGIGPDGHTLSLFPETEALKVRDRWFTANYVPQQDSWRMTATYPLAWRARQIFVLVSGSGKASILAKILSPTAGESLPAQALMDGEAPVTWLVDAAAAADLGDAI